LTYQEQNELFTKGLKAQGVTEIRGWKLLALIKTAFGVTEQTAQKRMKEMKESGLIQWDGLTFSIL